MRAGHVDTPCAQQLFSFLFDCAMTTPFDPASLSMTEIIRLQTVLSQELTRRFERKAALAFTDVVDSTRYFAQFGDEAGRRLQQLHLDLLEKAIDGDGRIVDTAGDGAFISFPSAMAAVGAMVALQQTGVAGKPQPAAPAPAQCAHRHALGPGSDRWATGDR